MTNKNVTLDRKKELNLCCVYVIEFSDGIVYVGQTTNFYRRKITHRNYMCEDQPKLFSKMIEFGSDNWNISILKKCSKEMLDFYEKKYIKKFDSANPKKGLNLQYGGIHGLFNKESKMKRTWSRKPVLLLDENKCVLREFESVGDAAKFSGYKALKSIKQAIIKSMPIKGYYYKFK